MFCYFCMIQKMYTCIVRHILFEQWYFSTYMEIKTIGIFFVLISLNYLTFKNKHFLQALKYFRLAFHAVSLFYFVGDIYMQNTKIKKIIPKCCIRS